MSKDPAFLFYPNDWLGGTIGMTFEQKGVYMDLLILQFNRGHMDGHMIGHMLGQLEAEKVAEILKKFKIDKDGKYFNERLEHEIEKRKAYVSSRNNNIKGINQYTVRGGHMDGHTTSHMENENIYINNTNINKRKRVKKDIEVKEMDLDVAYNFYKSQVEEAKKYNGDIMCSDYISFCRSICNRDSENSFVMPEVLKMSPPLSLGEFAKLYKKADLENILAKVTSIQTNVDYHGKYTNLYLTINNWINKDKKK